RVVHVVRAKENVHTQVVQQSGIQCYNCKESGDDTDDEPEDQELEAHYLYMAQIQEDDDDLAKERDLLASLIEKLKCEINDSKNRNKYLETSNKALVDELKDLKKFQAELDRYHDVNYASKVAIDCAKAKGDLMSYKMEYKKSFNEYTQKINDLNQPILEMKKELFAHQETISIMSQEKEAQIKVYKTREDKEVDKVIALENKVKVLDNIVYKQEMVADLRYFNSLEHEVDSLKSQLDTQKTQFLNEIDRLSKEYYYVDHMNVILGVYTELDEVTNLQCDYLKALEKCDRFEKELSKNKTMSKNFEALQKHVINLELAFQQIILFIFYSGCSKHMAGNLKLLTNFVEKFLEIILFIFYSGCSKHMAGNLKLLTNFVEKFLGMVKFRNDQIAPILDYGDLVQGKVTIKRVYYVKGLNHNLFSVGQFCDADLEVAFQKSTCYIRDLKGNDLLTVVSKSSVVNVGDAPNKSQRQNTTPATSTTVAAKTPPLNIQTTPETTCQAPTQASPVTAIENITQAKTNKENAQVEEDKFINIFSTPVQERGETSSRHVDSSNMHTFYQRNPFEHR
nr:integrase, catalytic region, zinc finger, CCHC-type, peptidase aspartic, catalytic [Tanacetum cinerariifolium]